MKLAYLSGKYSDPRGPAYVELNINEAAKIAMQLWSMGIAVICPHKNTQHFDGMTSYDVFMEGDLIMVERSDLVIMVSNWTTSKGAKLEREKALEKKIPVFNWPEDEEKIKLYCSC